MKYYFKAISSSASGYKSTLLAWTVFTLWGLAAEELAKTI